MARVCTLLLFDIILANLAIEDLKKRKIKNWHPAAILLLALAAMIAIPEISLVSRVLGMLMISIPMLILAMLLPGSFGGGDVKLTFACGAFLGWQKSLEGIVLAIFLAGIYSLWLIMIRKRNKNTQFAFGPFLSIGYTLAAMELF